MKAFLTVCTCAMVSAGIYGFVDMAHDVKSGRMIEYDHGQNENSVTAARLRKGTNNVNGTQRLHFNFYKDPLQVKVEAAPVVSTDFSFTALTASYSRGGIPENYYSLVYGDSPVAVDLSVVDASFAGTTKADTKEPEVKLPVVNDMSVAPVVADTMPVIDSAITVSTDVKIDSLPQVEEIHYDYHEFSRGSPRSHKKSKH